MTQIGSSRTVIPACRSPLLLARDMAAVLASRTTVCFHTKDWTEVLLTCGRNRVSGAVSGTAVSHDVCLRPAVPGVTEFIARNNSPLHGILSGRTEDASSDEDGTKEWMTELDQEDMNMLHSFGSLTTSALLDKVKELQDLAYQLGIDESRQMTRGESASRLPS